MNVSQTIDRLRRAHADAQLGRLGVPGAAVETTLGQIAAAIAPWRLPDDLVTFWRAVDPDTLALAACPRPASPGLSLRLWRSHLAGAPGRPPAPVFPWCYESHEFVLVELGHGPNPGGSCLAWAGPGAAPVRVFPSVAAYLDLLVTMIELGEFAHHPDLGVVEFDPQRRWADAQAVRLAAAPVAATGASTRTTIGALRARAQAGESPSGVIVATVVSMSGSACGTRVLVHDGTGPLDLWCPAPVCVQGPVIDRRFEFEVTLEPGCPQEADVAAALSGIERATRAGDMRAAVALATPVYDRLFGTPAAARALAVRPASLATGPATLAAEPVPGA